MIIVIIIVIVIVIIIIILLLLTLPLTVSGLTSSFLSEVTGSKFSAFLLI